MGKYLLGLISGVLLVFLIGVALIAALIFAARGGAPTIAKNSVLVLRLAGELPEQARPELNFETLRSGPRATLLDVREAILRAADDDRVRALDLRVGGLGAGWAKAEELRWAIEKFRESGKPALAYLQVASTIDYLVASAADEVRLAPEGLLDVKGLRAEVSFYKDMLAKIGVEIEMERIGKYKSAAEPFSRSEMSDAFREVTNSLLDSLLDRLTNEIARSRATTPAAVLAALDKGPFLPQDALDDGLVDGLSYEDQYEDLIREKLDLEEYSETSLSAYRAAGASLLGAAREPHLAVVYGVGTIIRGDADQDPFIGADLLGSESFARTLERVRENDRVKAVILRIDSPGGDAIASDEMWRALNLLKAEKPVVVSMSDVAASGGYYMAMAHGAPVLAYPSTLTGSIGVYFGKFNLEKLYEKIGLRKEILTRGRFAAIDTDARPLTPAEREKMRRGVEAVYQAFVAKVAEARGSTPEAIHEVAQGRVWLGSQALEQGLVDELGGLERAISRAKQEAGLDPEARIPLVAYPASRNIIEMLLDQEHGFASALLPKPLARKLNLEGLLPALAEGGFLAIAPYSLTIQ